MPYASQVVHIKIPSFVPPHINSIIVEFEDGQNVTVQIEHVVQATNLTTKAGQHFSGQHSISFGLCPSCNRRVRKLWSVNDTLMCSDCGRIDRHQPDRDRSNDSDPMSRLVALYKKNMELLHKPVDSEFVDALRSKHTLAR